jgi:hypothetical protein
MAEISPLRRCRELFAVENEVLFYDVKGTYLEGQVEANPRARRGVGARGNGTDALQLGRHQKVGNVASGT